MAFMSNSTRYAFPVLFVGLLYVLCAAYEPDRVLRLPGQPTKGYKPFKQYMGYVTINKKTGKNFFYALVESQVKPKSRPLILWLNGGRTQSHASGFHSHAAFAAGYAFVANGIG